MEEDSFDESGNSINDDHQRYRSSDNGKEKLSYIDYGDNSDKNHNTSTEYYYNRDELHNYTTERSAYMCLLCVHVALSHFDVKRKERFLV